MEKITEFMEDEYTKFVKHCLKIGNLSGIATFKEFNEINEKLKKDGFGGINE